MAMGDSTPPPPYSDVTAAEPHAWSSAELPQAPADGAAWLPAIETPAARRLPLEFNVYSESATSGAVYYMGPHRKDRQFALTLHQYSMAEQPRPFLILHDGLSRLDPAIGTSTNAWVEGLADFYDAFALTVSPLITGARLPGAAAGRAPPVEEPLVAVIKGTRWHPVTLMRYSVLVKGTAAAGGCERQEFEWQESSANEVLSLGGKPLGWRLVAVANQSETLAVCALNGGSLTKFLKFSFRGRGRATESFGPTWEVMAVLTGLTTWQRRGEIMSRMG